MEVGKPKYAVESVARTLDLIELLRRESFVTLSHVEEALDIGHSTAYRLLQMFVWRGYALQDPISKKYFPGPKLRGIDQVEFEFAPITSQVLPLIHQLSYQTGETAHFATLFGRELYYLAGVESRKSVKVSIRTGGYFPAHASSLGKVMLSTYSDSIVRRLYRDVQLTKYTENTVATVDGLLASLAQARRLGYGTNVEESEENVSSVSMAISTPSLTRVFGVSIATPVNRRTPLVVKEQLVQLRKVTEEVAAMLGRIRMEH